MSDNTPSDARGICQEIEMAGGGKVNRKVIKLALSEGWEPESSHVLFPDGMPIPASYVKRFLVRRGVREHGHNY